MTACIQGDILNLALEGRFDVIVHGCNCQCTMGAGIAKQIKARFPEAYEADLRTEKGARSKLGQISSAVVTRDQVSFVVVNAYTQFHWRGSGVKVDYDAVRTAMRLVKGSFSGRRIGYPQLGAGLAGGEWSHIERIINEELIGEDHKLVVYQAQPAVQADGHASGQ